VPYSVRKQLRSLHLAWSVQVFAVLLLIWIALNGGDDFTVGVFASLLGALLGTWLAPEAPYPWRPLRWMQFAGFFLLESFKGGFDVALRAIRPDLPINPIIHKRKLAVPPGKPTMLLTSFISLLPGTLSVLLDTAEQTLEVHYLAPETVASVDRLENKLAWVFEDYGERP
jgi:multicomponent Na+:H+ antiporter subunit E